MLLQVSGSQESTGVEIFPRELDNLLGLDPATIHKLEALQVDDLKKRTHITQTQLFVIKIFQCKQQILMKKNGMDVME